jgi:hypothetical protein
MNSVRRKHFSRQGAKLFSDDAAFTNVGQQGSKPQWENAKRRRKAKGDCSAQSVDFFLKHRRCRQNRCKPGGSP